MATKRDDDAGNPPAADSAPPPHSEITPFTAGDELLRAAFADSDPKAPVLHQPLAAGQVIADVYEIVERIGDGGMGIVYLARDRKLARKVALKLIRTGPSSAVGVARLVREAQAIAQLSHPNVVTVFQIGTHDEQPFVAMEYVDGGTARRWISAEPRTWREIVALYVAAGRGLGAAHDAHLVHRDFKPDNVLVGNDGRVRVADFGLVHSLTWVTTDSDDSAPDTPASVTKTGSVMGTPAYMAPEQRRGGIVDAAADQFAFAVALWEALTGSRPFSSDATEIAPPKRPIPRHVEVALRRALSTEPGDRWPSMAPLLAELARDPNARRRRIAYVGGGLVAIAAIATPLGLRGASAPEPCTDSEAQIARAWNAEKRAAVVTALGARVGALVGDGLDRYARDWSTGHRQACRDTRVTRSQSEDMLGRRMQCLFAARAAIDATVSAVSVASPETRANALDAIARLPALDRCGDIVQLAREEPLPTDPVVRKNLDEAARQLADVHVAAIAPKRIDRQEFADAALARARQVGWKPLVARALIVHAEQLKLVERVTDAIAELREAINIAIPGNLTDVSANAFAELATLLAQQDQTNAAEVALLSARAYDDGSPATMQRVLVAASTVASRAHKDDEAVRLARELVASADKDPTRAFNSMTSRHQLASVLASNGRFDEALPVLDEAIAWGTTKLGADHAQVGGYRALRASYFMMLGRFDETITEANAALAILERWYGQQSVYLAEVLLTIGDTYGRAGTLEPIMPILDRALACARLGDDPQLIAAIENQRVFYYLRTNDLAHAVPAADAFVEAALRANDFASIQGGLLVRGNIAKEQKRYADAERDFLRAIELGKPLGDDHPNNQNLRNELGRTWIALGRAEETRAMLTRQAQVLVTARDIDPIVKVETHTVLADALYVLGDKPAARTSVGVADTIVAANPDRADLRAIVDDWHAKHR